MIGVILPFVRKYPQQNHQQHRHSSIAAAAEAAVKHKVSKVKQQQQSSKAQQKQQGQAIVAACAVGDKYNNAGPDANAFDEKKTLKASGKIYKQNCGGRVLGKVRRMIITL